MLSAALHCCPLLYAKLSLAGLIPLLWLGNVYIFAFAKPIKDLQASPPPPPPPPPTSLAAEPIRTISQPCYSKPYSIQSLKVLLQRCYLFLLEHIDIILALITRDE